MTDLATQDDRNRRTWSRPKARRMFDALPTFVTDGERAAFEHVKGLLCGRPVLELGVGTGRTVPLFQPLTSDYRALDYLPEMVAACRARFPGARVDLGDARELGGLPAAHFGLVTFSWNGIDAVSHADRRRVLAAVRRVLRPDGLFFFSTLNLDGPELRERPWHVPWKRRSPIGKLLLARHVVADLVRWLRLLPGVSAGPGWAVAPLGAHGFGLLVHYTSLRRQLEELAACGFTDPVVLDNRTGRRLADGDDTRDVDAFQIVARG